MYNQGMGGMGYQQQSQQHQQQPQNQMQQQWMNPSGSPIPQQFLMNSTGNPIQSLPLSPPPQRGTNLLGSSTSQQISMNSSGSPTPSQQQPQSITPPYVQSGNGMFFQKSPTLPNQQQSPIFSGSQTPPQQPQQFQQGTYFSAFPQQQQGMNFSMYPRQQQVPGFQGSQMPIQQQQQFQQYQMQQQAQAAVNVWDQSQISGISSAQNLDAMSSCAWSPDIWANAYKRMNSDMAAVRNLLVLAAKYTLRYLRDSQPFMQVTSNTGASEAIVPLHLQRQQQPQPAGTSALSVQHTGYLPSQEVPRHSGEPVAGMTVQPVVTARVGATDLYVVNVDALDVAEQLMRLDNTKEVLVVNAWDPVCPDGKWLEGCALSQECILMQRTLLSTVLGAYRKPLHGRMCHYACDVPVVRGAASDGLPFLTGDRVWRVDIASIADREPPLSVAAGGGGSVAAVGAQIYRMRLCLEMALRAALERGRKVVVLPLLGAATGSARDAALVADAVLRAFAGCFERVYVAASSDYYTRDAVEACAQVLAADVANKQWRERERDIHKYGSHTYAAQCNTLHPSPPYVCLDPDATPCAKWQLCTDVSQDHRGGYAHPPPCPDGDDCGRTNDATHTALYAHKLPCECGAACNLAITAIDGGKAFPNLPQDAAKAHMALFSHPKPCDAWAACEETDDSHLSQFLHPPTCSKGPSCPDRKNLQHAATFRHITPKCMYGGRCPLYADPAHTAAFRHPFRTPCTHGPLCNANDDGAHLCTGGPSCPDIDDPEHAEVWIHAGKECRHGARCHDISEEHLGAYFHTAWNGAPWRQMCTKRWCTDYSAGHRRAQAHYPWYMPLSTVLMLNVLDPIVTKGKREKLCLPIMDNGRDWENKIDTYTKGAIHTNTPNYAEIKGWFATMLPNHMCDTKTFLSIVNLGNYTSLALLKDFWVKKNDLIEAVMQGPYTKNLLSRYGINNQETSASVRKYGRKFIRMVQGEIFRAKIASYQGNTNVTEMLNCTKPLSQNKINTQREARAALVSITKSEDFVSDFEKYIRKIINDVLALVVNPPGIGNTRNVAVRTNYTVFTVVGPHYGNYGGAEVVMVLKREIMHHPDFYTCPMSVLNYQDGDFKKGRPWVRSTSTGPRGYYEELDREKVARYTPGWTDAAAKEWITRVHKATGKSYDSITLTDVKELWKKQGPWSAIEGHLPYRVPIEYTDHVIMCKKAHDEISRDPTGSIVLRDWAGLIKVVPSPNEVKLETEMYHLSLSLPQAGVPRGMCFCLEKSSYEKALPMYLPTKASAHFWLTFTAMGPFFLTLSTDCDASCTSRDTLSIRFGFPQVCAFPLVPMAFVQSKAVAICPHFNAMFSQNDFVQYAVEVDYPSKTINVFHWGPASALNSARLTVPLVGAPRHNFLSFAGCEDAVTFPIIWDLRYQEKAPECILSAKDVAQQQAPLPQQQAQQQLQIQQPQPQMPSTPPVAPKTRPLCSKPFDCVEANERKNPNHSSHIRQYTHVCMFGSNCRALNDQRHTATFLHMKKDDCPDGSNCTRLTDPAHRFEYRHPGLQDFILPCRYGTQCKDINNSIHCRSYYHDNNFQFPDVSSVPMIN